VDLLERGELPEGCEEPGCCPCKALIDDYINHATRRGARRRAIEVQLGIFLKKHIPDLRRSVGIIIKPNGDVEEGYVYEFPPLEKCRADFEGRVGQKIDWPECAEWRVTSGQRGSF